MNDEGPATPDNPFHYHLELTPPQLKITHTALRSLLDDFGHEEAEVVTVINEVLAKLPDEHAIRAIALDSKRKPEGSTEPPQGRPPGGDGPPPVAA